MLLVRHAIKCICFGTFEHVTKCDEFGKSFGETPKNSGFSGLRDLAFHCTFVDILENLLKYRGGRLDMSKCGHFEKC